MIFPTLLPLILVSVTGAVADCNPLTTNGCAAIPGLASSTYSVDFTKTKRLPDDWIIADAANVTFGSNGIEFNFNKRKDAPYIWTNFYVAYGRIDVEMQVALGTGIISSAVMYSDDADEIDWEFSGSNFGAGPGYGKAQTNVFGKGFTGNYDRASMQPVSPSPQTSFHIYTFNWTPDRIDWIIDGVTQFSTTNNGQNTGNYQFPQTPSRLHIGMWDAGDPDTAEGTRIWAGGYTDYSGCPYVAYVKTVTITTPNPCKSWHYPDNFSGRWADVQCTNETLSVPTSAGVTTSAARPQSTQATYTVVAGDNGYSIADQLGCTFDQLSASNPGVQWDFLNIGQVLLNPNAAVSASTPTSSSSLTSSMISAVSTSSSSSLSVQQSSTRLTGDLTATFTGTVATGSGPVITTANVSPNSTTAASTMSAGGLTTVTTDACMDSMTASQFITSAVRFCSGYSRIRFLPTPTFLSGCGGDSTRLKSACSYLHTHYATSTRPASSPTTKTSSRSSSSLSTSSNTKTTSSNAARSNWQGQNAARGWGYWPGSRRDAEAGQVRKGSQQRQGT